MVDQSMDAIDLYADVDDFGRDQSENFHDVDLYDDVITSRQDVVEEPSKPVTQVATISNTGASGKKWALYVGNLTWWTTDQDLQDALSSIGVSDLISIKFIENRTNGQSKGVATVVVGSENSSRLLLERLVQKDLHGMLPSVSYCTKAALERLDPTLKKESSQSSGTSTNQRSAGPVRGTNDSKSYTSSSQHAPRMSGPPPGVALGPPPHPGSMSSNGIAQPRQLYAAAQQPPPAQLPPPGHAPPPTIVHMVPRESAPPPQVVTLPPPRAGQLGPPPQGMIIVDPRLPPPRTAWTRPPEFAQLPPVGHTVNVFPGHPPPMSIPPPGTYLQTAGPPTQVQIIQSSIPPPGHQLPPGAAHINPAFLPPPPSSTSLPPNISPSFQSDPYGRVPQATVYTSHLDPAMHRPMTVIERDRNSDSYSRRLSPDRRDRDPPPQLLSEAEFDEILSRNKTVSSSAISRAVQDASSGDYGSAIETLVTAVSLIKQSKIANDDRCKILISSLQDTLHGIELKSYGSKSNIRRSRSPRDRDIDRSRSRQQRSRSREYSDRGRDDFRDSGPRERSREPVLRERSRSREPYIRSSDSAGRRYESTERHREYTTSSRSTARH